MQGVGAHRIKWDPRAHRSKLFVTLTELHVVFGWMRVYSREPKQEERTNKSVCDDIVKSDHVPFGCGG